MWSDENTPSLQTGVLLENLGVCWKRLRYAGAACTAQTGGESVWSQKIHASEAPGRRPSRGTKVTFICEEVASVGNDGKSQTQVSLNLHFLPGASSCLRHKEVAGHRVL